ncbi:hypothetical protein DFQ26_002395 [Actinomortierella ambigua]|nr:hypothetical protein DFQ26_002395 [Actinomortierella ambigua]
MPPKRAAARKASAKTEEAPVAKRGGRKTKAEKAAEKEAAELEQQQKHQDDQEDRHQEEAQEHPPAHPKKQETEEQQSQEQCDQEQDKEEVEMAQKAVSMEVEAKEVAETKKRKRDAVQEVAKEDNAEPMETDVAEKAPKTRKGKGKAVKKSSAAAEPAPKKSVPSAPEDAPVDHDTQEKEQPSQEQAAEGASGSSSQQKPLTMKERMERLKNIRQQMSQSRQANRADIISEHQRSKTSHKEDTKKERLRQEAEKMLDKQEMEEAGEDYERSQFWGYSVESVEKWNEKEEAKKERRNNEFIDWGHANHKKYIRQVSTMKPNLAAYNTKKEQAANQEDEEEAGFYRDANSVSFLSDAKPEKGAVDRMAADVAKQIDLRSKRFKRKAHDEDADVNYINDANQRFNQKLSRYYDRFTKEIRDNFERGTAL